jgi:hypothetical protein
VGPALDRLVRHWTGPKSYHWSDRDHLLKQRRSILRAQLPLKVEPALLKKTNNSWQKAPTG